MAGRWLDTKLGEVLTLQRGFDLPAGDRRLGRFPVVASTGVVGTHCEPMVEGPGVVIGRSGSLGGAQYVIGDFWPLNTTLWVKDFKGNDRRFCYYLLKSLNLQTFNVGSGVPTLNRNHVHPLPARIAADVNEQRAIARILGALDDKIELNRRMNETLEAMARALFKSWFIDFDPVHAKAEGRDPGLPLDIAALFPDSFQDSDLGEIPKGWDVKRLADLCSTQYGYTASAANEPIGPKYLRVTDINKRNWIEWSDVPYCPIDANARDVYALHVGDLVVARMADPGKSAIIEEDVDAVFASYLVRLKTASLAHSYYIYGFLKSDLYTEYAEGAKSGSVQANMNAKVIVDVSCVVPLATLMQQYVNIVLPLRRRLVASSHESHNLSILRDALLPKLLSGELTVKDVESVT